MSAAPPRPPLAPSEGAAPGGPARPPKRRGEVHIPGLESPRARQIAFVAAEVLAVVALVVLAFTGFQRVLNSHDGRLADAAPGPLDPNFEGNVTPTQVASVFLLDASGAVSSVLALSLTSPKVGATLLIPPATVVNDFVGPAAAAAGAETTTTAPGTTRPSTIAAMYKQHSPGDANQAVADLLGTSFTESITLSHDKMVQLLQPASPLTIDNPDNVDVVVNGQKTHKFKKGKLTLGAADAVSYLETSDPAESDNARMVRQGLLWDAWFGAVAKSTDPNVVPGETTSGIGRYVRTIAPLQHRIETLPSIPVHTAAGEQFSPKPAAINSEVALMIPYPTSANPGDRIRVRLLDGAAAVIVPGNVEIVIIGNADSFDKASTQVVSALPELHDKAQAVQQALRVGTVVDAQTPSDAQDVTVIIGKDLADSLR
jgi:hypothetical protein